VKELDPREYRPATPGVGAYPAALARFKRDRDSPKCAGCGEGMHQLNVDLGHTTHPACGHLANDLQPTEVELARSRTTLPTAPPTTTT
jgi:hypothetical protein